MHSCDALCCAWSTYARNLSNSQRAVWKVLNMLLKILCRLLCSGKAARKFVNFKLANLCAISCARQLCLVAVQFMVIYPVKCVCSAMTPNAISQKGWFCETRAFCGTICKTLSWVGQQCFRILLCLSSRQLDTFHLKKCTGSVMLKVIALSRNIADGPRSFKWSIRCSNDVLI